MSNFNCSECGTDLIHFPDWGYPFGCDCGKYESDDEALEIMLLMLLMQLRRDYESVSLSGVDYNLRTLIDTITKQRVRRIKEKEEENE